MVQCSLMESTWELLRGNVKPNRGTTLVMYENLTCYICSIGSSFRYNNMGKI